MVTWGDTHTGTLTASPTSFQCSNTFNGAAAAAGQGVTGAEIKARHTTGNAFTIGQLRGLVGNADTKNGTTTTAYAVEGSVDVSAGGTITTSACFHGNLNNSGTVTTSYGGFFEGVSGYVLTRGVYTKYCNYGYYADNVTRGAYISSDAGAISGTYYSVQIDAVGTMSAGGDTMRGLGVFCTPAGVLGAALQGIYSSVDLGTSTHVSGRVAAIEGRIVLGAGSDTQPTESVLCLDFDNGRTTASITNSRSSYIMLRDRGATADLEMYTLLDFFDSTIATDSTNALISTTGDLEATHTLRCMAEDVPLWILCSNVHA